MTRAGVVGILVVVVVTVAAGAWMVSHRGYLPAPAEKAGAVERPGAKVLDRGEYLARAGDCVACHSEPTGKPFAGGRAMPTPFGNLYVTNITPDDETGIGLWTADDFYRAMHQGITRDGTLLYPAMPFAQYTKVTRADSDAIFAYLQSVPLVQAENKPHELRSRSTSASCWTDGARSTSSEGEYQPTRRSPRMEPRRLPGGGPRHCTMCHTAINRLGARKESQEFEGGKIPNQNWYAPSLTSNRETGLGDWSVKEIGDLLQVGISPRATVYGPMAEVVYNSLQYMTDEDAAAMAVYLKALPKRDAEPPPTSSARLVQPAVMESGRAIYVKQCAMCHEPEGRGHPPLYPPLAGNPSITMATPVNPIRMVLNGGYAPGTKKNPRPYGMPPFAHILKDGEVAAVVTYIRVAWNNTGTPVAPRRSASCAP